MREITPQNDVIDSRDVIARIEELQSQAADAEDDPSFNLDDDETEELRTLRELAEQCEGLADWQYGTPLIRDSYFVEYAQELADDILPAPKDSQDSVSWPYTHIDWKAAARELQYDYACVDFDGIRYWIRY